MKRLLIGLSMSLLLTSVSFATTTVSVTAHTAKTTALSATENTNNSNLANAINTHNAATTGEHGVTGTIVGTSDTQTFSNKTTGDMTWTTGAKAIFGNASRYIIDNTSVYAIGVSTHLAIPATGKLFLDGGAPSAASYITESSGDIIDIVNGGKASARFSPEGAGNYALTLYNEDGNLTTHGLSINAGDDGGGITCNFINFLRPDGTQCGVIRKDGAAAVAYVTTSDVRTKENIKDTRYKLNDLLKIKVRDFNFKGYGQSYTGFIAQELNEVFPEAVSKPADPKDMWGIDYGKLTPLLIKAIQEQQTQIDNLNKRIAVLEKKAGL